MVCCYICVFSIGCVGCFVDIFFGCRGLPASACCMVACSTSRSGFLVPAALIHTPSMFLRVLGWTWPCPIQTTAKNYLANTAGDAIDACDSVIAQPLMNSPQMGPQLATREAYTRVALWDVGLGLRIVASCISSYRWQLLCWFFACEAMSWLLDHKTFPLHPLSGANFRADAGCALFRSPVISKIYSAAGSGTDNYTCRLWNYAGTSMSCPIVAGSAALVRNCTAQR